MDTNSKPNKKTKYIQIRVTESQYNMIKEVSDNKGQSVTKIILEYFERLNSKIK